MNLIVSGADYSGAGLGKIVTPSPDVVAMFSNYTNKDYNRQVALQILLNAIGYGATGSIYSKLQLLQIPMLAASVTEAFYDIKKGSTRFTSTVTSANVATCFALLRRGLVATSGVTLQSQLQFTGLTTFEGQNRFSALGLDSTTTSTPRFLCDVTNGQFRNNNYNFSTYGGGSGSWGAGYASLVALNLTYATGGNIHYSIKSDIGNLDIQGTATASTPVNTLYLGLGNDKTLDWHTNLDNPVLFQAFGAGLTDAEASIFYSAMSAFIATMKTL